MHFPAQMELEKLQTAPSSHFSRSNDNSRVALLVCDERLLLFLNYLEGHGALEPTADQGRKRHTRDAVEVWMSPGESQH